MISRVELFGGSYRTCETVDYRHGSVTVRTIGYRHGVLTEPLMELVGYDNKEIAQKTLPATGYAYKGIPVPRVRLNFQTNLTELLTTNIGGLKQVKASRNRCSGQREMRINSGCINVLYP